MLGLWTLLSPPPRSFTASALQHSDPQDLSTDPQDTWTLLGAAVLLLLMGVCHLRIGGADPCPDLVILRCKLSECILEIMVWCCYRDSRQRRCCPNVSGHPVPSPKLDIVSTNVTNKSGTRCTLVRLWGPQWACLTSCQECEHNSYLGAYTDSDRDPGNTYSCNSSHRISQGT